MERDFVIIILYLAVILVVGESCNMIAFAPTNKLVDANSAR